MDTDACPDGRPHRSGDPEVLHIAGTVADWESWTKMRFPESGDYGFPAGLATVHIDRVKDTGEYWEPNIWLIHQISP